MAIKKSILGDVTRCDKPMKVDWKFMSESQLRLEVISRALVSQLVENTSSNNDRLDNWAETWEREKSFPSPRERKLFRELWMNFFSSQSFESRGNWKPESDNEENEERTFPLAALRVDLESLGIVAQSQRRPSLVENRKSFASKLMSRLMLNRFSFVFAVKSETSTRQSACARSSSVVTFATDHRVALPRIKFLEPENIFDKKVL